VSQLHFFQWLAQALDKPLPPFEPENPDKNRKRGVTNKRVSNRKLKMELGHQFKYPNFRKATAPTPAARPADSCTSYRT